MCAYCWRLVHRDLQYRIWQEYTGGSPTEGTHAYMQAVAEAIIEVRKAHEQTRQYPEGDEHARPKGPLLK